MANLSVILVVEIPVCKAATVLRMDQPIKSNKSLFLFDLALRRSLAHSTYATLFGVQIGRIDAA